MQRGQFVTVVAPGDYDKATSALVVYNALLAELPSVVFCSLTTTIRTDADLFRLEVEPSPGNGLCQLSQIATDKITVVPIANVGELIGNADDALLLQVNRAVALFSASSEISTAVPSMRRYPPIARKRSIWAIMRTNSWRVGLIRA